MATGSEDRPRAATQRDVARSAGVDRATVSRALDPRRRGLLSAATVHRVQTAADDLGYRPNTLAQGLRRQRSSIIGLSIRNAARDQSGELTIGAESRLRDLGMTLVVSFDDDGQLLRVSGGLLDGVIIMGGSHRDVVEAPSPGPLVTVGLDPDSAVDVLIDVARGIAIGVEHLHRLGHRKIGLLAQAESTVAGLRYRRAYSRTIERLLPGAEPLIASFAPRQPASVSEATRKVLTLADRPTALIVTDDAAASGAYGVARELGLRIPDDVSIVGYGDTGTGDFLVPSLTTISVPARPAGRRAVDALIATIGGKSPKSTTLTPHLVHRGSTAPPRAAR